MLPHDLGQGNAAKGNATAGFATAGVSFATLRLIEQGSRQKYDMSCIGAS